MAIFNSYVKLPECKIQVEKDMPVEKGDQELQMDPIAGRRSRSL
jgi:hypothetical protein